MVFRLADGKAGGKGFEEVTLSRATGWTYWEIVSQPVWFLERLAIYLEAEGAAEKIRTNKAELKAKTKYGR